MKVENWKNTWETLRGSVCKTAVEVTGAVRTGTAAAGQAAETAVTCAKWKKELAELKSQQNTKLRQIGQMVYATHCGNPTDSDTLETALREVDALRQRIEARQAAIAALSGKGKPAR